MRVTREPQPIQMINAELLMTSVCTGVDRGDFTQGLLDAVLIMAFL